MGISDAQSMALAPFAFVNKCGKNMMIALPASVLPQKIRVPQR
jgi:hypothetical protein